MSRASAFLVSAAAMCGIGLLLSTAPADAGTQCKSQTSFGSSWTSGGEASAWVKRVKGQYGPAWSSFALARSKQYSSQSFILQTLYSVTAYPCRHT